SVYYPKGQTASTGTSPLAEYKGGDPLAVTPQQFQQNVGELYGPMKVASEREARRWFGDRTTVIRPGLIVGPGDSSFRFTYWPYRIAQGGEILAPGDGTDPVQIIDARDLAEWTVRGVEDGKTGTFNATGPGADREGGGDRAGEGEGGARRLAREALGGRLQGVERELLHLHVAALREPRRRRGLADQPEVGEVLARRGRAADVHRAAEVRL